MSDKKDHVNVFNVELFYILAPKVEKKKVRWADEPRQQSATEGTLEMLTKSPLILSCLSSLSTRKLPPEQIRVDVFVDGKIYRINEEVEMKEGNKKYWGGKIIKKIAEEGIRNIEEGNVVVVVVEGK